MINLSIHKIAQIVNGTLFLGPDKQDQLIHQVSIDSRTTFSKQNTLFFALIGERNNGHHYLDDLFHNGVQNFVVSEKQTVHKEANFILVDDTHAALQTLAAFNRKQQNYPVIGITGSNGKTIIKEWLAELLSDEFTIVRSPKSYNSQVGVPLSVLLMNSNHNLGIFEAGISKPGEMAKLADIIVPETGIFTNIADAHQENFDSIEQKVREKLKLFSNCKTLIFNKDQNQAESIIDNFCKEHSIQKLSWSLENKNSNLSFVTKKEGRYTHIRATVQNNSFELKIPFQDSSSIENACHCFALISHISKEPKRLLAKFEKLAAVEMRLEIKEGINGCQLVNDYYNSDLHSLTIALSVLHQQAAKNHLHKIVILSDIQETGLSQKELYVKVNSFLKEWKIDQVIGIGKQITSYSECFSLQKSFYITTGDFIRKFDRRKFESASILIKGARQFTFEKISVLLQQKAHQTQLEINLNSLAHNLNLYKQLLEPKTRIMVMVKAFSYGSGDIEIAKLLQYLNVDYLAVAVADEGVQLRNGGITTPIVVMNPEQESFANMLDYKLEPNIYSIDLLEKFVQAVTNNNTKSYPIHIKLDTGMNRLGIKTIGEVNKLIEIVSNSSNVRIQSVFTHLAASDEAHFDGFTKTQFQKFEEHYRLLSDAFSYKMDRHILNSAGIERFPEKQYEMVRLGIGLYGVSGTNLPVENVGTLKSIISQVKVVEPGETVGYSRKGLISGKSKIGIVPLGYADGLDRKLGNKVGSAFVNGKKVAIVGNICMDMLMIDLNGVEAKAGDKVELFGENISIVEVAQNASTIPYEILTGISQRVKRIYLQE